MGDRRKLQAEIERCLRKVTEGVEIFEDIWQKVHSAPNHNQKDKYEQELKKEIKKLQRLRDQIKTWIASQEIKDKKQLQEARKNIEQQMERFKVVERETKTKAYSKEGLGAGAKLDPQEKEKEECTHWIREALQELQIQIDKCEADIETLSASLKKKKSDRDKQERLEETKHTIERHKFHIETLEKILRAIDNDAIDLKPIHNLRDDVEYYIESNQESDFKENEGMYEEIDLENLSTIFVPVAPIPTTTTSQSHSSSLSNGTSSSLNTHSTLIDISSATFNIHSHSLPNHSNERSTTNSHNTDNESNVGLTTPSSTQPSSPSASPALSSTDDRKRNKSESEDNQSQRNRANSGANGSSTTSNSYASSPKNPLQIQQQSPNVSNSTKTSSHFTYPTSTQPVLQYSTIVSQHSLSSPATTTTTTPPTSSSSSSTTTNNSSSTSKQPTNIPSPQIKQISRQTSESTTPGNTLGLLNQQILSNISQISGSSSNTSSTVTLANGTTIPASLYSGPGSTLPTSNIPHQISSTTSLDPLTTNQQSPLLSHTISETERALNPPTSLLTNGSLEGHSSLDINTNFSNLPSTSSTNTSGLALPSSNVTSSFLSNDLPSTNTSGVIGQLPDHHTFRYPLSTSHQSSIQTNRVPLTASEARTLNRLNSAYAKLPSLLESERQRTNANRIYGRNPLGHVPMISYYPQTPPTGSDMPEFYYRLAPDTLFFVFYYMEGTRAQYLAAKALKKQSWRFHTKHMMWFQRYEEPKSITDDYEQGTYIFFDYERWQTRKRDNFIFEYKFLEDREF